MAEPDSAGLINTEATPDVKLKSFTPDELLTCDACLRANAPTRGACMYCGAPLASNATIAAKENETVSPPATASTNCYVVVRPKTLSKVDENMLDQLGATIAVKNSDLRTALVSAAPLLVASTHDKANQTVNDLRKIGIDNLLVTDEDLQLSSGTRKIRALELTDEGLMGLPASSGPRLPTPWAELILGVVGRLQTHRSEIEERRRGRKLKPIDQRELTDDETVLDLYVRSSEAGWRISTRNFDFSCLADRKTLTTFDNFRALINLLRERAALEIDESYIRLRPLLSGVWPLQKQTRKGARGRSGAGKYDVSTVTTTDNETQFNNYSRLLWFLKMRELECQEPDR
ncbi:MAG TPA: hypothetical protein VNF70_06725 [Pyrinomonadaceae bacterium]|nr:hypothetical protein [Pyrinomonadaceae bacterium]